MKSIPALTLTTLLISSALQASAPKTPTPVIAAPKYAPKFIPITPKVTTPVAKTTVPKTIPIVAAPKIQSTVTPTTTTVLTTKLPVQINIKNTSNFSGKLTGFTIMLKDQNGQNHALHQNIPNSKFTVAPDSAKKILPVEFNLKATPGTFFVGTAAIFINEQKISTIYKNQPWNRGITDNIYVTCTNGSDWKLDIKSMNNAYQKLSQPNQTKPLSTQKKVTSTTKAAAVPILQEQHNPKPIKLAKSNKHSKAAQASAKATKVVEGKL